MPLTPTPESVRLPRPPTAPTSLFRAATPEVAPCR